MPELRIETLSLPIAPLGPPSPLPPLPGAGDDLHAEATVNVPGECFDLAYGRTPSVLPYSWQDGYGRDREPGELRVAVLENDRLRATIALDLGARLWSLVDKETGRELLYRNPVLQPANLALRNAWFSGGVEWNLGTTGHTPLTCAPMHAARVDTPDGPVLRVWEHERLREIPYQLDFALPEGSRFLYVHVRLVNTRDVDVPVYWWSNIAVPATPGARVIAPADGAYRFAYEGELSLIGAPVHDGLDYTYPDRAPHAADYFFRLEEGRRPWIAAVDASGTGLVQTSTARLTGRKLFVWGENPGGHRWQDWLTEPGSGRYLEIQAGLARTQLEHLPMPAGESWTWVEAYGAVEAEGAHGDWAAAREAVERDLRERLPVPALNVRLAEWDFDAVPGERLHTGSGWGALEEHRRRSRSEPVPELPGIPFAQDTIGPEQEDWLTLAWTGSLPEPDPAVPPVSHVAGPWNPLLVGGDWSMAYHRGIARAAAGDLDAAREEFRESAAVRPNAWALRALGHLDGDADAYLAAWELAPGVRQLAVETGEALLAAGRAPEAAALLAALPPDMAAHGRVTVTRIRAAIATGALEEAAALFAAGFDVPDLREGEISLDALWFELAERTVADALGTPVTDEVRAKARADFPLPARYDFRMIG
ncbi:hypothetical protein Afil01_01500 [Actinorhabdospora filicis]|uniref:DUF5107 domain-containing protein n=1 Tax=Actinorhabdospora filicis TaxID=1785913 RepID=A0A9W6SG13_9ACTN|nr:DUF5107 domain-containing protein [Actinorhabdospora filicis]GLZ75343.1 hypothetical protein Afil01_01500 [Actinorhabdospora filicis]